MPWLGHRRRGSSLGFCRQLRRSLFGSRDTGMPWLGCPAARAPIVPRWLNVCGLVSCVGWSQLWLGVKTTGRCQIHSLCVRCVCVVCAWCVRGVCVCACARVLCVRHVRPSARALSERASAKRDWLRRSCAFLSPVYALHILAQPCLCLSQPSSHCALLSQ